MRSINRQRLVRRTPVILLKLWSRNMGPLSEMIASWRLSCEEVAALGDGLYGLLPSAGQAQLVEAAYVFGQRVFLAGQAGSQIRALVFPGEIESHERRQVAVVEPLLSDIQERPPALEDRVVYLTGYAVSELEGGWQTADQERYVGPSGRSCSLYRLVRPIARKAPWRIPELLGKTTRMVGRETDQELKELVCEPLFVVSGPFGSGKTRSLFQSLLDDGRDKTKRRAIWLRAWGIRSGGPTLIKSLAQALVEGELIPRDVRTRLEAAAPGALKNWWHGEDDEQLGKLATVVASALAEVASEGPLDLVLDDLHEARALDLTFVERLLGQVPWGSDSRLGLGGRSGGPWEERFANLPKATIGTMNDGEAEVLWSGLIDGLSMPAAAERRFFEAGAGFPSALEDGLVQLVRRRYLRQLYGNYFFSGPQDVAVQTTSRMHLHLDAEVRRLGPALPLLVLACADSSVPAKTLAQVAGMYDTEPEPDWALAFLASGLLEEGQSSWGTAISFSCPTHRLALRSSIGAESLTELRHTVAEALSRGGGPEGAWERYELLAGSAGAIPALLEAVRRTSSGEESRALFEAVRRELENHRNREGDAQTELELLWAFLPLARSLGRLRNLGPAIDRALVLAETDAKRRLALVTLKAEHAQNSGRLREAEACLLEGLEIAKDASPLRQSMLLIQLGQLLHRQERFAEARKLFEDFLPSIDQEGNPALAATCRYHLGNIALREHKLPKALEYHQQALRLRQENLLHGHLGSSLASMGTLNLEFGNYPRALRLFEESREVLEEHGAPGEEAYALLGIGRALTRLGDYTNASQPFRQALELRDGLDNQTGEAIAHLEIGENQLQLGHIEGAIQEARKAHFRFILLDATKYVGDAERLLGKIHFQQRQYDQATSHFAAAFESHQQRGHLLESTFDRARLLEAAVAVDDHEEIDRLTRELLRVMNTIPYPELGERLDLRLYRGMMWLRARDKIESDPSIPLERAYNELCRKTELLDADLRNRFLFQIPDNRAIVNAATMHGLTLKSLSDESVTD